MKSPISFVLILAFLSVHLGYGQTTLLDDYEDVNTFFSTNVIYNYRDIHSSEKEDIYTLEDTFIRYYRGLELLDKVEDTLKLKFYDDFSLRLSKSRLFDESNYLCKKGIELGRQVPDYIDVRFFYNQLANNYLELKKHDSVTWAFKEVIKINKIKPTNFSGLGSYNDLGYHYYLNLKKYDSALYYFNKRDGYPDSVFNGTLTLDSSIKDNIALVYMEQGKYAEAGTLFKKNYEYFSKLRKGYQWRERWLRAGLQYADVEILLGNYTKARSLLSEIENHFNNLTNYKETPEEYFKSKLLLLKIQQRYAYATRQFDIASTLVKTHFKLQDSLNSNRSAQLLEDAFLLRKIGLQNAKNTLKQEKAISAIEKENLALDLKRKSARIYWSIVIGVLIAIIIFGYFHFKKMRKHNELKNQMQEEYSHNLIKTQEKERSRLARELHDSVGQKLMLLSKTTKTLGSIDAENLASSTLEEIRSISRGLHPSNLERLGLTESINALVYSINVNTDLFFTDEIDNIDDVLSKESELHLYRIIQETLSNVVKHSEAKAVKMKVDNTAESLIVVISDNGKGFDFESKYKSMALGLKTLFERAKMIGGQMNFNSNKGKGTEMTLTIPI
ncbi:sensor histidine kinase [uncultured Psychroserpens sp.]|uniref:ATP-binding protein n=1 Tax=uncultured Psychroserpens sp. TaxID=255436 RepID=UPI00263251DB|nr:sensor histidine kinase [uncultured Psychroserpens sp.]